MVTRLVDIHVPWQVAVFWLAVVLAIAAACLALDEAAWWACAIWRRQARLRRVRVALRARHEEERLRLAVDDAFAEGLYRTGLR